MPAYRVGVVRTLVGCVTVEAADGEEAVERAQALASGRSSEELDRLFTVLDEEWVATDDDVWLEREVAWS